MMGALTGYALPVMIGALLGLALGWYRFREIDAATVFESDPKATDGDVYRKRPVNLNRGYLDTLKELRQQRRERKALKQGYVRWHLVGNRFSRPRFVEPTYEEGANIPSIEYDDVEYLFPDDAMIPDAETGVYTIFHHEGRSDPMTFEENDEYAIDANTLKAYGELRVTTDNPSGLGLGFLEDLTPRQIMTYGIAGIVGYFVFQEVMAGGLI